jgi:thiol:disulfide interchange protein DsbD
VELIADRGQLQPGTQWLGVKFTLEPGWHVYWLNPGDSGEPPEVRWRLPTGVAAGPIEWPVPQRLDAGGIVNYGYRGSVVLGVPLTVSASSASQPAVVGATVRFLVCRDVCVSGQADLELRWPLGPEDGSAVAAWSAKIADARALVPRPTPSSWSAVSLASAGTLTLTVLTGRHEDFGVFFPLEAGQIDDAAEQVLTPLPDGLRFRLRRAPQLVKDPVSLRGVVAFPDGRAFEITVPVSR